MEITYLGHACFKLKSKKSGTVITDPYAPSTGPTLSKPTADIVTLSHSHADHSAREQISGIADTILKKNISRTDTPIVKSAMKEKTEK